METLCGRSSAENAIVFENSSLLPWKQSSMILAFTTLFHDTWYVKNTSLNLIVFGETLWFYSIYICLRYLTIITFQWIMGIFSTISLVCIFATFEYCKIWSFLPIGKIKILPIFKVKLMWNVRWCTKYDILFYNYWHMNIIMKS